MTDNQLAAAADVVDGVGASDDDDDDDGWYRYIQIYSTQFSEIDSTWDTVCLHATDIQPSIDLYGLSVWHIAVIPVYTTHSEFRVATIKSSNNGSETHSARFWWENRQQSFIIAIAIAIDIKLQRTQID